MRFFYIVTLLIVVLLDSSILNAQCSVCTKTVQQLGDGPASGLNTGIIYLAFVPLVIFGYFGYRWWQKEKLHKNEE